MEKVEQDLNIQTINKTYLYEINVPPHSKISFRDYDTDTTRHLTIGDELTIAINGYTLMFRITGVAPLSFWQTVRKELGI